MYGCNEENIGELILDGGHLYVDEITATKEQAPSIMRSRQLKELH